MNKGSGGSDRSQMNIEQLRYLCSSIGIEVPDKESAVNDIKDYDLLQLILHLLFHYLARQIKDNDMKRPLMEGSHGMADRARTAASRKDWNQLLWTLYVEYYLANRDKLMEQDQYKDRYLAIKDFKVIDHDEDKFKLSRRMDSRHPDEVVLIVKLQEEIPAVDIPAPFFADEV